MSCEWDHDPCCELLSASDTASPSVRELYRRPSRRRPHRHCGRRRLLHQHSSCPNNCIRSDEVTSTSADELSAVWTSRRTRSDLPLPLPLPPLSTARYKTDKSRHSLRPQPTARRRSARHLRTTTIVHHPCCLFDPKMCPVMKGSQHRHSLRPEDIDSDIIRETEKIRAEFESYLFQQQEGKPQKAPCKPEATAHNPRATPQHQSNQKKPAQQSDPRQKMCKMCGSMQRLVESTAQYVQCHRKPSTAAPSGQPHAHGDRLTQEGSSEAADRLLDELNRRSAGPRATRSPQRVSVGDVTGQQRNHTSAANTKVFPSSTTAGHLKGDAGMMTNFKLPEPVRSSPLADLHQSRMTTQNLPHPRSSVTSPFMEDYYSRRASHLLEHANDRRAPAPVKTGPPMTQNDVDASYTMHSIVASARATTTKNTDNENTQRYAAVGAYSYEKVTSQPEKVTVNFQQTTRRPASEGTKPSVDVEFPTPPPKGTFTFGDEGPHDSKNQDGRGEPDLRIMPQSEPDSARYTACTFETDITELQQTGNHTEEAETCSSNGDYQSHQTPTENGDEGSSRHMDGVGEVLKGSWQGMRNDGTQVNGAQSRAEKLSSLDAIFGRSSGAGDVNHHPNCQRSSEPSPLSRKSIITPITHRGDGNHQESDVRKSANSSHKSLNVAGGGGDDSTVYSRQGHVDSFSKPDDCGSCSHHSNSEQCIKQQEATRSVSRSGTPTAESGCKSTPNAEEKTIASSQTSRSGSTAGTTKTMRRRHKDRGDGDHKGVSSESNDSNHLLAVNSHASVMAQLEITRKKITDHIDNVLASIVQFPNADLNVSGSQAKLQSGDQMMGRSKSITSEQCDSSDLEPLRDVSSQELSSELWAHVSAAVRDSLPQHRPSKGAPASSGEYRNNIKLLMKLRRDLTKNIVTSLKRLEDIESLLHRNNGEGPSDLPNK